MKIISKLTLGLVTATLLFVGCNDSATPKANGDLVANVTEASLGLRKTDLYSENSTSAAKTEYTKVAAGSGYKVKRAFQDAPPMIPHDTEGMLPIKIGNNQCVGCHEPAVAASMGATPYPKSHMTDFRPTTAIAKDGRISKNGKAIDNTSSSVRANVSIKDNGGRLTGARFNCSQCHVPQSQGNLAVENNFQADYTQKNGTARSSWTSKSDFLYGLDTIKGSAGKVTAADIANKNSAAGSLSH